MKYPLAHPTCKLAITAAISVSLFFSCSDDNDRFDASGSFEANETIISAEASGVIEQFSAEEGQVLEAGQ